MFVCVCAVFFLSFLFIFYFELCACLLFAVCCLWFAVCGLLFAVCGLLFAVCDKWVDFRGGDAVQQCNALLMFYV